eukprot:4834068-Prymnesium_polylepis.1
MAKEEEFVEDVELFLTTRERSQLRRKQALHKEWEDKASTAASRQPVDESIAPWIPSHTQPPCPGSPRPHKVPLLRL